MVLLAYRSHPSPKKHWCMYQKLSLLLSWYLLYLDNLRISKQNNFPYFFIFIIYFCFVLAPIFGLLVYFESFRIYIMSFPCLVLIASLSFSQCILSVPHCLSQLAKHKPTISIYTHTNIRKTIQKEKKKKM